MLKQVFSPIVKPKLSHTTCKGTPSVLVTVQLKVTRLKDKTNTNCPENWRRRNCVYRIKVLPLPHQDDMYGFI